MKDREEAAAALKWTYRGDVVEPDWNSWQVNDVVTPWGKKTIEVKYRDPLLAGWKALVVEDTLPVDYGDEDEYTAADGVVPERITTMVLRFPRIILPEFNTHRAFSRNSASSRARSFKTTLRPVMEDPFVPLFTVNQKGMGGKFADNATWRLAFDSWLRARDRAVYSTLEELRGADHMKTTDGYGAVDVLRKKPDYWGEFDPDLRDDRKTARRRLEPSDMPDVWEQLTDSYMDAYRSGDLGDFPSIHKQDANRLIEPFMWHEALTTSTYWKNFLDLRISEYAQPEIKALAILVREALKASEPEHSWLHLPFISKDGLDVDGEEKMEEAMLASASECARISYKDRSTMTNRDGSDLGRRLLAQKHMSPFEHIAVDAKNAADSSRGVAAMLEDVRGRDMSSNLSPSWVQYRRLVSAREQ